MNQTLKGTQIVLVALIVQVLLNLIILGIVFDFGVIVLVDTIVILLMYLGLRRGKSVAALFAVMYGIIAIILRVLIYTWVFDIFLSLNGVAVMIAGIIALKDNGLY